jgi:hypothetical protein
MDLDVLKEKWAEHDRKLDVSIRLNRQLMREVYTRRARAALLRLAALLALGSISMIAVVVALGSFIYKNLGMPQFVWPAVVLEVFSIAVLASLNAQIALALQTDYGQPIATIQKRLEKLRKVRIRYIQGVCLTAALTWAPLFIVAMKAFLGVDVYQTFDRTWLASNVLFGLAIIPLFLWLARKFGKRMNSSTSGRQFMNDIAGYNLKAAIGFLATLAEFESENGDH